MQDRELEEKHRYENDMYEKNATNMEAIKAQKKSDKARAQEHWQQELSRVQKSTELASPSKDLVLKSPM